MEVMPNEAVEAVSEISPKMARLERESSLELPCLLDSDLGRKTDLVVLMGMEGHQVSFIAHRFD